MTHREQLATLLGAIRHREVPGIKPMVSYSDRWSGTWTARTPDGSTYGSVSLEVAVSDWLVARGANLARLAFLDRWEAPIRAAVHALFLHAPDAVAAWLGVSELEVRKGLHRKDGKG